jgi:hypothetical protein
VNVRTLIRARDKRDKLASQRFITELFFCEPKVNQAARARPLNQTAFALYGLFCNSHAGADANSPGRNRPENGILQRPNVRRAFAKVNH